jgi:DNA-binding MarR family transcriptional regulator
MDFENSATYTMTQLALAYRSFLEKSMNEIGLHSGQIFILIALWKSDGQSQIDLVKNLNVAPPTVNKMIKSLSAKDFVESRKCGTDGRIMRVFLTDKGREHQTLVAEQWRKLEAQSFMNLTEIEKLILLQLFGKLKDNLGKNAAPIQIDVD